MRPRPSLLFRAATALALALVAGVAPLLSPAAPTTAAPSRPGEGATTGAPRPPSPITWELCEGLDPATEAAGVRCASVPVPLDYRRPRGRWIEVVIARRPASDPARRRGVLVTTGGGPGGPGVPQVAVLAARLPAAVTDVYDIVGVDQRFVERSTPISCGEAAEEPGAFWVRSPAIPIEDVVAQARAYAQNCAATAGWALPHATTANAARDLDRVRVALGEARITFVGSSYAAYVGAVYARLFPQHLDRAVMDSPVDPALAWRPFELARSATFQAALDSFCAWTADRDAEYALGATGPQVCGRWWTLVGRLSAQPLAFWTADLLGLVTFSSMYDEHTFGRLASIVSTLDRGEVAAPPPSAPEVRAPGTPADNHTAASTAYRCGDAAWPTDLEVYRVEVAEYGGRFPFIGGYNANLTPCAFWPVNRDARVQLGGAQARGVLVIGATGDPATPYAGAVAVREAFPRSRLVTLDAVVHAPLQAFADPCVDAAVAAHLLARNPRRGDVRCGTSPDAPATIGR